MLIILGQFMTQSKGFRCKQFCIIIYFSEMLSIASVSGSVSTQNKKNENLMALPAQ